MIKAIYMIFEQCGIGDPTLHSWCLTKEGAKKRCRSNDHIPGSGTWLYKKYVLEESNE